MPPWPAYLIEAELRAALADGVPLPGFLPEGRVALAAVDGLAGTYTSAGLVLDRLTVVRASSWRARRLPPLARRSAGVTRLGCGKRG